MLRSSYVIGFHAWLTVGSIACIEVDTNHCSYKGRGDRGHAWCQQTHPGFPLCSRCAPSDNGSNGCVSNHPPPPRRCLVGERGTDQDTGIISSTSTSIDIGTTSVATMATDDTTRGDTEGTTGPDGNSTTTAGGLVCGESSPTPANCGPDCANCEGGICDFSCMGASACQSQQIICDAEAPCHVLCAGPSACADATITCPPNHTCEIECYGDQSCMRLELMCGDGPCSLGCHNNPTSCEQLQFHCGDNDGVITCTVSQLQPPILHERGGQCTCEMYDC